jgi:GWxTD domain-containing protein
MNKMRATVLAFLALLAAAGVLGGDSAAPTLAPRFQSWLDMVDAIAGKEEKEIFRRLDNDRDRDAFIAIFWRQRDPSPGTPENEYRLEIQRRFDLVNRRFGGGSGPGWKTDMGRYTLILGEPRRVERFDEHPELYPVQVWHYAGDAGSGLPSYFNLTFFRPRGGGPWRLYDPALDGPGALLHAGAALPASDPAAVLARIARIAPTLAGPAQSMLPNENGSDGRAALQNSFLLGRIAESPLRRIGPGYAADFPKYKSFVDVESSVRYVPCSGLAALTWEPRLAGALAVVSLKPRSLTLAREDERGEHSLHLRLTVNVRDGERLVHQQVKDFRLGFAADRVEALQRSGLVIHDAFPLVPGHYQVVAFAANVDSREFSYFDQELSVPEPGAGAALGTPLIGFRSAPQGDALFYAYRFLDRKLYLDPEAAFGMEEAPVLAVTLGGIDRALWETGRLALELSGSRERAPFRRLREVPLRSQPFNAAMAQILSLDGEALPPDYYRALVRLLDGGGRPLAEAEGRFTVSPAPRVAHAVESYKAFSERYPAQFAWIRAGQYQALERLDQAERSFQEALALEPGLAEARLQYVRLLNRRRKPETALAVLEPLNGNARNAFDYHALRGEALSALARTDEALSDLEAARRLYDSDPRVLNLIGFARLKRHEEDEALRAFTASLALKSDQPDIAALAARLRAGRR